jgi:hypothetical protein
VSGSAGHAIERYDGATGDIDRYNGTTGAFMGTFVPRGAGGLLGMGSFDFGGDGLLYVDDGGNGCVLRFDAATDAFRDVFITPDQYHHPEYVNNLNLIAVAVPEPGAWLALPLAAAPLLRRRRQVKA